MARNLLDLELRPAGTVAGAVPAAFAPGWAAHAPAGAAPDGATPPLQAIGRRPDRRQPAVREPQGPDRPCDGPTAARGADPVAAVRAVVAELEPELAALRPRLHLGWLPPLAVAPADLRRLLGHLIGNALQHRAPVKPRLEIGCRARGEAVELAVADNGPGIPAAMRERVFEPFCRLPSARSEPGPGLGLAVCRTIVEGYGGRIWVEPGHDGGSRFCCTLPAA